MSSESPSVGPEVVTFCGWCVCGSCKAVAISDDIHAIWSWWIREWLGASSVHMWQLRYSRDRNRPRGPGSASKEPSPLHPSGLPNCYCWVTGKLASVASLLEHGVSLRCLVGLVYGIATCLGPINLAAEPMDLILGHLQLVTKP